jgi:hypothetical protein
MKFFNRTKKEKEKEKEKEKNKITDYIPLFIKESNIPPARFGKSVYIRKEHHDRISQIVHVIGDNDITITDYIDNVLANHFKNYEADIIKSFNDKILFK